MTTAVSSSVYSKRPRNRGVVCGMQSSIELFHGYAKSELSSEFLHSTLEILMRVVLFDLARAYMEYRFGLN